MADKNFVVKNGLVVNTNLIYANGENKTVGINNTSPDATLTVSGTANVSGKVVLGDDLDVTIGTLTAANVQVGPYLLVNTIGVFVGNSTVNVTANNTLVTIANSTSSANLSAGDIKLGSIVVNTSAVAVGANARINTSTIAIGNSVSNLTVNSSSVLLGNATVNVSSNSSAISFNGNPTINATSYTGTAANATLFNNQPATFYANADNLTSGTLSNARLPAQVVNTSGNFTLSGNLTLTGANVTVSGNANFVGSFINVASAFVANSTGAYHTGTINALSLTAGANVIVNASAITFVGNSTTSPTITIANTGAISIGNTTTTQTGATIIIANSSSNVVITPAGISGNGYGLTINASKIEGGTIPWSQLPPGTVNTSGSFTMSGNTTLAGTNTTISSNLNVTGSFLNVASAFIVNSTGTFYNGSNVSMNSSSISYVGNTTTSPSISLANTGALTIGNSTTTQTGSLISIANSSGSANISPLGFSGNGYNLSVNAAKIDTGTIPSARISGAYTGINNVGTLGTLTVAGNTSLSGGSLATNTTVVTVNSSNVNIDTGLLFVDSVNNRVGIKNTTPDAELTVTGSANIAGNLTVVGDIIIRGNTVSAGTTEYTGSLTPSNNSIQLGNATNRWVLSANTGNFSGPVTISTVLVLSQNSISYAGNTTTLPTITLANTGSFTIGNGTTTQTSSQISVSNSISNVTITPAGISGNGFNLTSLNATSITSGTLASARIAGSYTGINAVGTLDGLTVTGNVNIDSGVLFVDGSNNRVGVNTASPSVSLQVVANDAIVVPVGNTAQRPTAAVGMLRYNGDINSFEAYSGASWGPVSETNGGYYKGNNGTAGNTANKANLFRINANTQTSNITIIAGENATATGPITIQSGMTLTIDNGGRVVIV